MTFNQITLKNLRQNIKHYGMFLFSLLLSIVLYFSFSTLKHSHSINNSTSMAIIQKDLVRSINFIHYYYYILNVREPLIR